MSDLNTPTGEMRILGMQPPSERGLPADQTETSILRFSRRALTAGLAIPVIVYIATLSLAVATHGGSPFDNPSARLYATLSAVTLMGIASSLVNIAGTERVTRQSRTLIRRAMDRADANADIGAANQAAIETNNRLLAQLIVLTQGGLTQIDAVQQTLKDLPDYGTGVIHGVTMRSQALGEEAA